MRQNGLHLRGIDLSCAILKNLALLSLVSLFLVSAGYGGTRIALLPAFTDFSHSTPISTALPAFEARLQAELVTGWDSEILSRAGLSTLVFEQKLRAVQSDKPTTGLRLLPAELLVISVLDCSKNELRVFATPVNPSMALPAPKSFPIKGPADLTTQLPKDVAKWVASVSQLKARVPTAADGEKPEGKAVVCALLDPVGAVNSQAISHLAPLIRGSLENAVAGQSDKITLVDRSNMAALLDEKALKATQSFNPNAFSSLATLVKADLILIPFAHSADQGKIGIDLFAVEVSTGRVLACASWTGALLDAPPSADLTKLLSDGAISVKKSASNPVADEPKLRHAEAKFLISLQKDWDGLRSSYSMGAMKALRLGDASMALANDDIALFRLAVSSTYEAATPHPNYPLRLEYDKDEFLDELKVLQKSGQAAAICQAAKSVFELPMMELAKQGDPNDVANLAILYTRVGEAQKGWDVFAQNRSVEEIGKVDVGFSTAAIVLLNLKRYQDVVKLFDQRTKWKWHETGYYLDALRATNDPKREFQMAWANAAYVCTSAQRMIRFLDLAILEKKAEPVVNFVVSRGNAWELNELDVRLAIIRARVAAGQKDIAISEAQTLFLTAKKQQNQVAQNQLAEVLKKLDAKPIEKLFAAKDFITLPNSCRINLIYDQTQDGKYVSEVAGHVSRFWGCPVHLISMKLDMEKISSFAKISQAVEGGNLVAIIRHVKVPTGPSIGTVFLTQTRLISQMNGYVGSIYGAPCGSVNAITDHFFRYYQASETRKLPEVTAIAVGSLNGMRSKLWRKANENRSTFSPPPPDLFATNGILGMIHHDLGISADTGRLLKLLSPEEIVEDLLSSNDPSSLPVLSPADQAVAEELSQQISKVQVTIIKP